MNSDLPKPLQRYLSRYILRRRAAALIRAIGRAVSLAVLLALVVMAIDRMWWISSQRREALRAVTIALPAALLLFGLIRSIARRTDRSVIAAAIEKKIPELGERLITLVSQYELPSQQRGSGEMLTAMASQTLDILKKNRLSRIAPVLPAAGAFLPAVLLCGIGYIIYSKPQVHSELLLARFADPRGDHSLPVQRVELTVQPGAVNIGLGKQLRVLANVHGTVMNSPEIILDDPPRVLPMASTADGYAVDVAPIDHDLDYLVRVGEVSSPKYHVHLLAPPAVAQVRAHYDFPAALKIAARDETAEKIEAIAGTSVTLSVRGSQPIASGKIDVAGKAIELAATADPALRTAKFVLEKSGTCTIQIANSDGLKSQAVDIPVIPIVDQPPKVALLEPATDVSATPFDVVRFKARASDDLGLESVAFRIVRQGVAKDSPAGIDDPQLTLDLAALGATPGDTISVQAIAKDRAGQVASSEVRSIKVDANGRSIDELAAARKQLQRPMDELRERIARIEKEPDLRQTSVDLAEIAELCGKIRLTIDAMSSEYHQQAALDELRSMHWTITGIELSAAAAQPAILEPALKVEVLREFTATISQRLARMGEESWPALVMEDAKQWQEAVSRGRKSAEFADQLARAAEHEQASADGQPGRLADLLALSRGVRGLVQQKIPVDFLANVEAVVRGAPTADVHKAIDKWAGSLAASPAEVDAEKIASYPPAIARQIDEMLKAKAAIKIDGVNGTRLELMRRVEKAKTQARAARGQLDRVNQQAGLVRAAMDQLQIAAKRLRSASADEYIDAYNNVDAKKKIEETAHRQLMETFKFKIEASGLSEYAPACDAIAGAIEAQAKAASAVDLNATTAAGKAAVEVIAQAERQVAALQDRLREVDPLAAGMAELGSENDLATEDLSHSRVREVHSAMLAEMRHDHPETSHQPQIANDAESPGFDDALHAYFAALAKKNLAVNK